MSIDVIKRALSVDDIQALPWKMSVDSWAQDYEARGEKVALFRNYADGDHRSNLTDAMRKLLRIQDTGSINELNVNHIDEIVQTMVDRLKVDRIESDADEMTEWVKDRQRINRFDALQGDVHEAALRDADTFIHVHYDDEGKVSRLSHESAWDGSEGVLVVYPAGGAQVPVVAIKAWTTTTEHLADSTRVNVYLPGEIRKYLSTAGSSVEKYYDVDENGRELPWPRPWVMKDGTPIGVPFVHFKNRAKRFSDFGLSEVENAIPLQDVLNRINYSMVMNAEMAAFGIRAVIGAKAPRALTPGLMMEFYIAGEDSSGNKTAVAPSSDRDLKWLESIRFEEFEQQTMEPFIEAAKFTREEMYRITRTPSPSQDSNDSASGESLKQRDSRLLGKVERFQVKAGNGWEDVFALAHRVEEAFADETPPAYEELSTKWAPAEIRDDSQVRESAKLLFEQGYEKEALRQLGGLFDWDAGKIDDLVAEKQESTTRSLSTFTGNMNMPTFDNANFEAVLDGTGATNG